MTVRSAVTWGVLGLVVVVGLPLAGYWSRRQADPGCALDGTKINPYYRVDITDAEGRTYSFCCIRCAEMWLERQSAPVRAITVTDEHSGQPIDAGKAFFVRSLAVNMKTTGNRIHVFGNRDDAEKHAATYSGTILSGAERPFAR
jgi:hypothetical protein